MITLQLDAEEAVMLTAVLAGVSVEVVQALTPQEVAKFVALRDRVKHAALISGSFERCR